ncbi:uncharacterized protein METZ01_LOCUS303332, partial [marine metagenome]
MNKIVYILFLTFIVANDAPVWTDIPNQTIEEDCNPCTGFPIDLNTYVSDIDGDNIEVIASEVDGAIFSIDEDLFLNVVPNQDFNTEGSDPIILELTASDAEFDVSTTFDITITAANDAPVLISQTEAITVDEDCCLDTGIELTLSQFEVTDVDNTIEELELKISEVDIPDDAPYTVNGLFIIPTENYFGEISVPVYIQDLESLSSEPLNWTATINPVNDDPYFEVIGDGDIVMSEDILYQELWLSIVSSGDEYEDDNLFF